MIARVWHGYTTAGHADAYEAMLKPEPLPGLGLFAFRKLAFKRIEATDSLLVFRRAIEERDQGGILFRRVGVERQNLDQAAARLDFPALLLEHEPRGGRVRQLRVVRFG